MRSSVCASGSRCTIRANAPEVSGSPSREVRSRNRMLATPGDQEHPGTQADHRHVDRQPVGLQRGHHRRGVGVEPAPGHRQQNQHRQQQENPQRAVLRSAQHDRAGDQPAKAGQVDELVHVAPRHPHGRQAAQHDADQQQPDAGVDQGQPGPPDAFVERAPRGVGHDARRRAVGGHRSGADQLRSARRLRA